MRIKFLGTWQQYNAGEIAGIEPDEKARELVEKGIAAPCDAKGNVLRLEPKKPAPAATGKDDGKGDGKDDDGKGGKADAGGKK